MTYTWSIGVDLTLHDLRGREPGEDEQDLLEALEALDADGPVTGGGGPGILSARFCVDALDPMAAGRAALDLVSNAIAKSGVAAGDPVAIDVVLYEDMVAENEGREIAGGMHLPHLVGVAEIAEVLGLSRQRVYQLIEEHQDFPQPAAQLSRGALWNRRDIQRWAKRDRRPGRPRAEREAEAAG